MCGIFGWDLTELNLSPVQRAAIMAALTIGNDDRGGQGWGYASFRKNGKIDIKKGKDDIGFKTLTLSKLNFFMAHTRYATQGKPKIKNCHPFEVDHIIGAHNGMLDDHEYWNSKFRRSFTVDSQHLFANIARNKDFLDMCGYGSIEWIDRSHVVPSVLLCKMQGGVLAVCQITIGEKTGVVWSSDRKHLLQALEIANLGKKSELYEVKQNMVYKVHSGQLWKTDMRYEFGIRYDRNWRSGLSGSSTKSKTTSVLGSSAHNLDDAWVRGNELDFDPEGSRANDTLCGEGEENKLIKVAFDDGVAIEAVFLSELLVDLTVYEHGSNSYITQETLDDFIARTCLTDSELDQRWVDLEISEGEDHFKSEEDDIPDDDYEVGKWNLIGNTSP